MKFWQRTYYSVLLLFLFSISVMIFSLSVFSYRTNLERQLEHAMGEAYWIVTSMERDRAAAEANGQPDAMETVFRTYASYYEKLDIDLQLWEKDAYLAGDSRWQLPVEYGLNAQTAAVKLREHEKYAVVSTPFSQGASEYTLVYFCNLQEFVQESTQLTRGFLLLGAAVTLLLAAGLYALLRWISRPIEVLNQAASSIAAGDYAKRVPVRGQDELSALAGSFNHMAEEIARKIRELQIASEQKQKFIDNLSHELRTPLTVLRGNAEYIRSVDLTEEEKISAADDMLAELDRLEDMTRKLMDLAFLRNQALERTAIAVEQLFASAAEKMRHRLEEAQLQLVCQDAGGMIRGDKVLLESLLCNLIENAMKACAAGSAVRLLGYAERERYIIAVQDSGKGVAAEHLAKLTEPFYRVDQARTRQDGGAGLGLSLCAQIAELHQAVLDIESTPGVGTTVRVIFTQL